MKVRQTKSVTLPLSICVPFQLATSIPIHSHTENILTPATEYMNESYPTTSVVQLMTLTPPKEPMRPSPKFICLHPARQGCGSVFKK